MVLSSGSVAKNSSQYQSRLNLVGERMVLKANHHELSSVKIIAQASVLNCHIRVKPADNAMIAGGALGQDLVQDRNPLAA